MKLLNINNLTARRVLAAVRVELKKLPPQKYEDYLQVQSYANCREQGFCLHLDTDHTVAFAEWRRSDEIVVYFGGRKDFDMNTNIPSEEAFENARFFNPHEYEKAAKFIMKYLRS